MHPSEYMANIAATKTDVPHGAFRLYVILKGAAVQGGRGGDYFPVTLEGLRNLHPGISGQKPGSTTLSNQVASLRNAGLLETVGALHRNNPRKPMLVKVLDPDAVELDLASVANTQ